MLAARLCMSWSAVAASISGSLSLALAPQALADSSASPASAADAAPVPVSQRGRILGSQGGGIGEGFGLNDHII